MARSGKSQQPAKAILAAICCLPGRVLRPMDAFTASYCALSPPCAASNIGSAFGGFGSG